MRVLNTLIFTILIFLAYSVGLRGQSQALKGTYINQTIIDQCHDSIIGMIPRYMTEIRFDGSDKAELNNGFETYFLSFRRSGKEIILQKAYQMEGKLHDLVLIEEKDRSLTVIDSSYTGIPINSKLVPAKTAANKWAFENALNAVTVAGNYFFYQGSEEDTRNVALNPDGSMEGLGAYTSYQVCYAGDCMNQSRTLTNLIAMTDDTGMLDFYAWEKDPSGKNLIIYNLSEPEEDINGERIVLKDTALMLQRR